MATNQFLNKIKKIFLGAMVGLFGLLIVSSIVLDDSIYANENYLLAQTQSVWYRLKYSFVSAPNVLAGFDNVFNSPEFYDPKESHAQSVPILNYHGVVRNWDGNDANISQRQFEKHMFALKEAGYQTVSLDDLYAFKRGERELPPKAILISFDDGRRDSLYGADPILRALDFTASMFVISKFSTEDEGGGYYLSEKELAKAVDSGVWEIGAHAHEGHADTYVIGRNGETGNFYSNKLWLAEENRLETDREYIDRTATDLVHVKRALQASFGKPITTFAFPFGEFGQVQSNAPDIMPRMMNIAQNMFTMLFYQHAPNVRFTQVYADTNEDQNSFLIRRISVPGSWDADNLLDALEKGSAKPLPYEDVFRTDNGWVTSWGNFRIDENNGLELVTVPNETGASVVLDGTGAWKDYELTALVESPSQTGAFVWVRFKDDTNAAACNFSDGFVHVEQTVDGIHRVIQGARGDTVAIPAEPFTIGVRVEGRTIECFLNGEKVAQSSFLDTSLDQGGIGFKKWHVTPERSSLIIKRLEIMPIP